MNIQISSPCHQDWNTMTTDKNGKFCNACAKNVVDFTSFTEAELQRYFVNFGKKSEPICGRFTADQAVAQKPIANRNKFLGWCWFAITTILLFLSKQSKAQQILGEATPTEQASVDKVKKVSIYDKAIALLVKDAMGNALSGVKIYVDNKLVNVQTNKDGSVSFLISKETKIITIEKNNYVTKIISISDATFYKIEMFVDHPDRPMIMGKIMIAQPVFDGKIKIEN
jgi:RNA recognition motif-containing protein